MNNIRIGFGYDVHKFEIVHAICDALLGAANLRDIGYHFSDKDAAFKNIDSKILLEKVMVLLDENGWILGNIDATIAAQQPKIAPHIDVMKQVLAEVMQAEIHQISIKATTTEKLGFVGREEGMSAYAVALIFKK